jgi:hypothetical protein
MNCIPIHPNAHCPVCNYGAEAATGATGQHHPVPGSLAVCLCCASLNQYRKQGNYLILVEVPADVMEELRQNHPETLIIVERIQVGILSKKAKVKA